MPRSRRDRAHVAWPFERIDFRPNDGDVSKFGDVELFPPTLSLQWNFNPDGRVQPFVGAGVNYTMFSGEHLEPLNTSAPAHLELDHSWGAAAQAGINVKLSERWFVGADVRWIDIDSDARIKYTQANPRGGLAVAPGGVEGTASADRNGDRPHVRSLHRLSNLWHVLPRQPLPHWLRSRLLPLSHPSRRRRSSAARFAQ
jgi:hypothetical protein